MILITWNMQWGRGVDGRIDLQRIVSTARALGDFDVLCLQEVADNYPDPGLAGLAAGVDQFAQLRPLLPGYQAIAGVAVERFTAGIGRQRFGNMLFSRLPVLQVLRHQLPWPADASHHSMPRLALEAVLATPLGALRVTTTHLEYYSEPQRADQIEALRDLQQAAAAHACPRDAEQAGTPFEPRPRGRHGILTGDFNCPAGDPLLGRLQAPLVGGAPRWVDAWPLAQPGQPHPPTLGLHDHAQWPQGPSCFDFVFVTENLAPRVRRMAADLDTQASDHQPLLLEIDLRQ